MFKSFPPIESAQLVNRLLYNYKRAGIAFSTICEATIPNFLSSVSSFQILNNSAGFAEYYKNKRLPIRAQALQRANSAGVSMLISSKVAILEASKISISRGRPFSSRCKITPSVRSIESASLPSLSSINNISASFEDIILKDFSSFKITL